MGYCAIKALKLTRKHQKETKRLASLKGNKICLRNRGWRIRGNSGKLDDRPSWGKC